MFYLPRLLEHLKRKDYIPQTVDRLAEALQVPEEEFPEFRAEVNKHLRQGTLVKLKKNRVCLPRDADLVTGIVRFRQSGSAILLRDPDSTGKQLPPLQIRAEDTSTALHGDRVVARLNHRKPRRRVHRTKEGGAVSVIEQEEETGRIIRILERAHPTITGTLRQSRRYWFVIPDEPRIVHDILVNAPESTGLDPAPKIDDKVVVQLMEWEKPHLAPEGEIIEVLGRTHTPGAEYKALLHQYSLDPEFPDDVMREVRELPDKVTPQQLQERLDLRDQFVFTIDPQDAKDFDDALSIEEDDDGNVTVGVHIADVSAYVKPGTALDQEARRRGNSTYLVGRVIPMLPHALSNGVCSLVEGEDRLTKSVFLKYSKGGKLLDTTFANTVIFSRKRLTYEQAYALLFEDDLDKVRAMPRPPAHQTGSTGRALDTLSNDELGQIKAKLQQLWGVAKKLRQKRMRYGSLDLDMPESKIYVDPEGWADRIVKIEHDESHQLIEEFMLAANEGVAKVLNHRNIPLIHRVHDKPDAEKLDDLSEYMEQVGISTGDLSVKKHVIQLLQKIKSHPQSYLLRVQLLRSLKQAQYRATPDGHYGLGKKDYTHFTSPIRRYSDLIVHRIFDLHLARSGEDAARKRLDKTLPHYTPEMLATIAQHLSITEQNSTEAERESNKIKLLEFFERQLEKPKRQTFPAIITDVRNHGLFIELVDSMAFGLIPTSSLTDDFYSVSRDQDALVGRRSKRKFKLGQRIEVVTYQVDRFKRQIDFTVAGMPAN
ncbi:MAG: RNB domain-containing ribonuclease [Verrucomicrobiota bacterium JB022]|nr:RNB domain-containing ribonuclease [Verrucomicrobiota bacterium JB022]